MVDLIYKLEYNIKILFNRIVINLFLNINKNNFYI